MKKEETVFNQRIVKKGVFDLASFVAAIKDWFGDNNYDWGETRSVTKEKDKGIEVDIAIEGEKDIDDYFRRGITVEFLLTRAKKVKGDELVLDQGNIEVIIKGSLTYDYDNLYHTKFLEAWKTFQQKYIINKDRKDQIGRLYTEVNELVGVIKGALGLS